MINSAKQPSLLMKRKSWIASSLSSSHSNDDNKKSEEATMSQSAKRVVLASRPAGEPKTSDFIIEDYALPTPGEGQVLLRTIWLSLEPYMRGRRSACPAYAAPAEIGTVWGATKVSRW